MKNRSIFNVKNLIKFVFVSNVKKVNIFITLYNFLIEAFHENTFDIQFNKQSPTICLLSFPFESLENSLQDIK